MLVEFSQYYSLCFFHSICMSNQTSPILFKDFSICDGLSWHKGKGFSPDPVCISLCGIPLSRLPDGFFFSLTSSAIVF